MVSQISGEYMDWCISDVDTDMEEDKIGSIPYMELDSIAVLTNASEDLMRSFVAG